MTTDLEKTTMLQVLGARTALDDTRSWPPPLPALSENSKVARHVKNGSGALEAGDIHGGFLEEAAKERELSSNEKVESIPEYFSAR
jgi:hypothetical protein